MSEQAFFYWAGVVSVGTLFTLGVLTLVGMFKKAMKDE